MDATTRIFTTLNHEEPDRVPAFESAFINDRIMKYYGYNPQHLKSIMKLSQILPFYNQIQKKVLSSPRLLKGQFKKRLQFALKAGLDIDLIPTSLFPLHGTKTGFIDEYGRKMNIINYEDDGSEIYVYEDGMFKTFEDFERWTQPDPTDEFRIAGFLGGLKAQQELDNEILAVPATAALFEVTWESFGMRTFSRILRNHRQIQKVFDTRGQFTLELVKNLADHGAKLVLLYDDYGFKNGLMINPKQWREYVYPWLDKIVSAAHKKDCKIMLHSDGDLSTIIEDIVRVGIDALNPIEPTTANPEYDIFNLKKKYGDKLTLVGNISPMLLASGEQDKIAAYSKKLLQELGPGGGYIFSSGHSINPAVSLESWQTVLKVRKEFGQYPI
jgi:uroporphyrinogen decarboxylase